MTRSIYFILLLLLASCRQNNLEVRNEITKTPVLYAIGKLNETAYSAEFRRLYKKLVIRTSIDTALGAEAFRIKPENDTVVLTGGDATGVMYGLLSMKEQIESGEKISNIEESPRFSFRAIKFNLPWDSYRRGKALQLHYETCRDTNFWRSFLDMMAENRFNKLTLWNLHPFSYMVKTEKYPEACGFSDEEMKTWEKFWKSIFRMAKERGVETYIINWNIFVSPEFAKAHNVATYCIDGKYFVDQGDTSAIVKDYTREVVKEVINRYPDLTGLGITLGEGMGGMTAEEREKWLLENYIQGMRQASRKVKFIHRVPLSAGKWSGGTTDPVVERMTRQTLDTLTCTNGPINIELKFNWSHSHSCTDLVKVHGGPLTDAYWNPPPQNYKLAWMMRNEDFFVLRWGQTGFIREHISKNGHPWVNGYYVGSECYIPAKDYITSLPNTSYHYAFERQWMFYKVWGRLLYNPETPDEVFSNAFEKRFHGSGNTLFIAQQKASRIPLIIGSYWNATWDNTLYSEGLLSIMDNDSMKLISLEQMCNKQPMSPSYMSIKDYLASGEKSIPGKITPAELADSIESFCNSTLKDLERVEPGQNTDLLYEVSDMKVWAHLGLYFADKLRSAVQYQKYLDTKKTEYLKSSVVFLETAVPHWDKVCEITVPIYKPMPMQHYERNGDIPFHWNNVKKEVYDELHRLKGIK